MKAAWDWHLPRETAAEQRAVVDLAAELGFDTLIVHDPTAAMLERGRQRGLQVLAVIGAQPDQALREQHPEALQQVRPAEAELHRAVTTAGAEDYQLEAHQWFPQVLGDLVCFAHEVSHDLIRARVSAALEVADGVAFDGFGFRTGYACFCDRCQEQRRLRVSESGQPSPVAAEVIRDHGRELLVAVSELLYAHAKERAPQAIVTNHVWPPFRPDPYYGSELQLDYCTQTISWFYRPVWSLERVELEAAMHQRLQRGERNRFVPFIGLYHRPYLGRSADRLAAELELAVRYGDGHLVLCTLESPAQDAATAAVVRAALAEA